MPSWPAAPFAGSSPLLAEKKDAVDDTAREVEVAVEPESYPSAKGGDRSGDYLLILRPMNDGRRIWGSQSCSGIINFAVVGPPMKKSIVGAAEVPAPLRLFALRPRLRSGLSGDLCPLLGG